MATLAVFGMALAPAAGMAAQSPPAAKPCVAECFVLTSLFIQGVTAYPLADLAPTYEQNLARQIGVDDLVLTATAITDKYRADGYFLTRAVVGPQSHSGGSASILVYEGYIADVVVEGAGAAAVTPLLSPLAGQRTLKIGELDRRLALASDVPGVKLTSRIEPILDDPAQHRLVVTAELDRFDGGLFTDNRGAPSQGPWQTYLTGAFNSAFRPGDQLTLSSLTTPARVSELTFAELAYSAPLAEGRRLRLALSGYTTGSSHVAANGWIGGRGTTASASLSQPLIRGRYQSLWANAALDLRHVEQTWTATGLTGEDLSVARLSLTGQRRGEAGYVSASLQLSQGLDAFGSTTAPSPRHSRRDADSQFTKVNANLSAYRDLGRIAGVYGAVTAQWSDDPLLASEEFAVGGASFGRAYNYGEISGDQGLAAVVELRVGWDPKLEPVSFFQLYGFMDAASVSNHRLTGDYSDQLASAGAGLRLTLNDRVTLKLEAAKPLSRTPYTETDNGWRAFLSLSAEF